jgi:hypothetical protein
MSIPLEFAAIETVLPPEAAGAEAGVDDAGGGVLVDVLLELLPHPAATSAMTAVAANS